MEVEVPYRLIVTIVIIAVLVGGVVGLLYSTPLYPRFPMSFGLHEGFVPRNVSEALRALPEANELLSFLEKSGESGDGLRGGKNAVQRELELLLHKMTAFVSDLTSTDRLVNKTRHLPFETAHDRLVVGELCGMCLQQTVTSRDLDIMLEAWLERGFLLIRKLCTVKNMSETDAIFAEKLWKKAWEKVYLVATSECIKPLPSLTLGSRDAVPFEPVSLVGAQPYQYTYGGLSASGGNGVV